MRNRPKNTYALHRNRSILGILAGMAFGYIFALDITGWYFLEPTTLVLFELIGAFFIYRITHGLLQDKRISKPVKTGYVWALCGLIIAHIVCHAYIYLDGGSASFSISHIDFAESMVIAWIYSHLTFIGFAFGAFFEMIRTYIQKKVQGLSQLSNQSDTLTA